MYFFLRDFVISWLHRRRNRPSQRESRWNTPAAV